MANTMTNLRLGPIALLSIVLSGCASTSDTNPVMVSKPAWVYPTAPPVDTSSDSLYRQSTSTSFFEDNRAARVGDLVSVLLVEETMASKNSDTSIAKTNETDINGFATEQWVADIGFIGFSDRCVTVF